MAGADVAAYLNQLYTGFDEKNDSSPVGIVLRTTKEWKFYCEGFANDTGCFNGRAECITSASIFNHRVMVKEDGTPAVGLQRDTGIVFNTSMIEEKLGRCTYQYDGGSLGRYNRGCGMMAHNGEGACDDKASPWYDLDPATGKPVTDDCHAVMGDYCQNRIDNGKEPLGPGDAPCFWRGPAFTTTPGAVVPSETHQMLRQRMRNQAAGTSDLLTTWDEVVIDSRLLYEQLVRDPTVIVPAIIYQWSPDHAHTLIAKTAAEGIAKAMQKEFNMPWTVPLVGVDTTANVTANPKKGPFFYGYRPTPLPSPCCFDTCDAGACAEPGDWCAMNHGNCASCNGHWCDAPSGLSEPDFMKSLVV